MMNLRQKTEFVKLQVDFVSQLGKQLHSLSWWSTWMSSKNRFRSRLTDSLEAIFSRKRNINSHVLNGAESESFFAYSYKVVIAALKTIKMTFVFAWESHRCFWKLWPHFKQSLSLLEGQKVYLVKTFAYKHSFTDDNFRDVFFEELPDHFREDGYRVVTIYDPLNCLDESIAFSGRSNFEFPIQLFWRPIDLFKAWSIMIGAFFRRLPTKVLFLEEDVSRIVHRQIRLDSVDSASLQALLTHFAFKRMAKYIQAERFLLTSENNPWERTCIMAMRLYSPETKIIGYQHTVVPECSTAMFPGIDEVDFAPLPDSILTVGSETAQIMRDYGNYKDLKIDAACAVRFKYLENLQQRKGSVRKTLLVAFEAAPGTEQMLELILKNRARLSDWKIILRTHPAMSMTEILQKTARTRVDIADFELSKNKTIQEDLERCGVLLYWGSSVSLEALKLGIPVLHYELGRVLSFDPLFRCDSLKWLVSRETELRPVLDNICSLATEELESLQAEASGYMRRYFHPVTPENLQKFIEL